MAMMNSIGDKGSPCRNPVKCLNHLPFAPFSKTAVVLDTNRAETQDLHLA
jgi:hypothetical protein